LWSTQRNGSHAAFMKESLDHLEGERDRTALQNPRYLTKKDS
jgi:hypothetical protein